MKFRLAGFVSALVFGGLAFFGSASANLRPIDGSAPGMVFLVDQLPATEDCSTVLQYKVVPSVPGEHFVFNQYATPARRSQFYWVNTYFVTICATRAVGDEAVTNAWAAFKADRAAAESVVTYTADPADGLVQHLKVDVLDYGAWVTYKRTYVIIIPYVGADRAVAP